MSPSRSFSMRARLLWLLLAAIAVTVVVQAVIAYGTAHVQANGIFDYHMQQMAMSLRSGLAASAPTSGGEAEPDGRAADFSIQVWTSDGMLVFPSTSTPQLAERPDLGFSNVQSNGVTYRVFSMRSRSQVIQVAQDMNARSSMARTLALRTVAPILVMAPLLMLIVWGVVSTSLAPVARVRTQVAQRQPDELDAVSEDGLPEEIRPLIQELNQLFCRVRQSFDAQNRFVADAAHELRSPLAALKLQLLGLDRATDEDARRIAVGRLGAGIERATRLVEQLLALARQQALSAKGVPAGRVQLAEVARSVIVDATPAAVARHIDLGMRPSDESSVAGSKDAVLILLGNLVDNAIKYTPEGGSIDVEVRRVDDELALSVEDSGPGIPAPERARVLDRFYRLAEADTIGSGLGLPIVKAIADMHGATLSLDRSNDLGGLRVVVTFPAVPGSTAAPGSGTAATPAPMPMNPLAES